MLSSYKAPFQNFEDPQISTPNQFPNQLERKSENAFEISQQDLDNLVYDSKNYFSKHLDAKQFRLRLPRERPASFNDVIDSEDQEIRNAVSQSILSNGQQTPQYALRHIAIAMNSKKYDDLRISIDRLYKENFQCFASVYSFISSLIYGTYSIESNYLHLMEHLPFPSEDLPHFFHLLDELATLPANDHILLASFLTNDTNSLIDAFRHEPHVMPLISSNVRIHPRQDPMREPRLSEFFNQPQGNQKNKQNVEQKTNLLQKADAMRPECLFKAAEESAKRLPRMNPVLKDPIAPSIPNLQKADVSNVAISLLTEQFNETIKMATNYIQQGVNLADMYVYRAIALLRLGHIPAAIADFTRSIEIEPTDQKLRARAACWKIAGENGLAYLDLNDNKMKDDIGDILNSLTPSAYHGSFII